MKLSSREQELVIKALEDGVGYIHVHDDGRKCMWTQEGWMRQHPSDEKRVLTCNRKGHPSREEVDQWYQEQQADPVPTPDQIEQQQAVLDFPHKGIRWPVPTQVYDGILEMFNRAAMQGSIQERAAALQRVGAIHQKSNEHEGCVECGRRSGYPCPTMIAAGDLRPEEEEGEQMSQDGINIETKEGEPVTSMQPSDEGVEHPEPEAVDIEDVAKD